MRPRALAPQLKRGLLGSQRKPVNDSNPAFDNRLFEALDQAPYALSLRELARKVDRPEQVVEAALGRLVAAGRVNMTADVHTRAYYTKNDHLR